MKVIKVLTNDETIDEEFKFIIPLYHSNIVNYFKLKFPLNVLNRTIQLSITEFCLVSTNFFITRSSLHKLILFLIKRKLEQINHCQSTANK